jgi:hypothetical protein
MKKINLGYVQIETFCKANSIWLDWMQQKGDYRKEMEANKDDDKVLKAGEYQLVIDYPVSTNYTASIKFKKAVTRKQLALEICKHYRKMYNEEDKTAGGKTKNIPGILNRASSAGKYGIWGHHIGDLMLHTATVNNRSVITLGVDS